MIAENNIDEIVDLIELDISEKNTERFRQKVIEEEKYEQDIKALKKRLDFLNNSNWRLIESSLKKQPTKSTTKSTENQRGRQSDYIYTENVSEENNSSESSKGPDIMQYVSEETLKK